MGTMNNPSRLMKITSFCSLVHQQPKPLVCHPLVTSLLWLASKGMTHFQWPWCHHITPAWQAVALTAATAALRATGVHADPCPTCRLSCTWHYSFPNVIFSFAEGWGIVTIFLFVFLKFQNPWGKAYSLFQKTETERKLLDTPMARGEGRGKSLCFALKSKMLVMQWSSKNLWNKVIKKKKKPPKEIKVHAFSRSKQETQWSGSRGRGELINTRATGSYQLRHTFHCHTHIHTQPCD